MSFNSARKKAEFINIYGAAAYLRLSMLEDILREKNIDIKKVDKKQLAKLLGCFDTEIE